MGEFTHFDCDGNAVMVDVNDKEVTYREAIASGTIKVNQQIIEQIRNNKNKKGDVLGVSRIAGIMAVKKTSELIPLCHPLIITKVNVDFSIDEDKKIIECFVCVKCDGKTGVEMEALNGVSITLLTIYDMCKAVSKDMVISNIHLVKKSGGKNGDFIWKE